MTEGQRTISPQMAGLTTMGPQWTRSSMTTASVRKGEGKYLSPNTTLLLAGPGSVFLAPGREVSKNTAPARTHSVPGFHNASQTGLGSHLRRVRPTVCSSCCASYTGTATPGGLWLSPGTLGRTGVHPRAPWRGSWLRVKGRLQASACCSDRGATFQPQTWMPGFP